MIRWLVLALLLWPTLAWAQPSPNLAHTEASLTDSATFETASFALTANRLAVLAVYTIDASIVAGFPSISGHDSWTEVMEDDQSPSKFVVWCKYTGSGSTDTIALDYTSVGGTQLRYIVVVVEWSGAKSGSDCSTDALLQKTVHKGTATNTTTSTFAACTDTRNRFFFIIGKGVHATATNDWTELSDEDTNGEGGMMTSMWDNNACSDTDVVVTFSSATNTTFVGIELEVVAAVATDIQMGTGMSSGGFMD